MKKLLVFLLFGWYVLAFCDDAFKVVYDLTTKDQQKIERNILKGVVFNKNYYEKTFQELEVAVVIHGDAYKFFFQNYHDKELLKRLQSLHDNYDVEFLMCNAGLLKLHKSKKDIVSFVKLIPNSTLGLIEKQNSGFAYIPVR